MAASEHLYLGHSALGRRALVEKVRPYQMEQVAPLSRIKD